MIRAIRWFYRLLGAGSLANGLWMLASPYTWFVGLPAGVTDTGPINFHFVHDLGVVFCIAGLGALWCARHPQRSAPVHFGVTAFYAGHALVHVAELLGGRLPAHHWLLDAPLTFAPALALLAISLPPVWRRWSASPA
jgi:hypothetical protein